MECRQLSVILHLPLDLSVSIVLGNAVALVIELFALTKAKLNLDS